MRCFFIFVGYRDRVCFLSFCRIYIEVRLLYLLLEFRMFNLFLGFLLVISSKFFFIMNAVILFVFELLESIISVFVNIVKILVSFLLVI